MAGEELKLTLAMLLKDGISSALGGIKDKLGGLGTAVLGAAGVAVGGIAVMGKKMVEFGQLAADEQEGVVALGQAVKNTGANWDEASEAIEGYLAAELKRTALDDGEGREAIQKLTEATGDYKESMKLMAITQDLARAKGMDLSQAAELVGKVYNGQTTALKRYGITLDEGADSAEAFAAMQQKFGGQAEAFANTNAGAQQRLQIAMGNLKETIGGAVLPIMTSLAEKASDLAMRALPVVEVAVQRLTPIFESLVAFIEDPVIPIFDQIVQFVIENWPIVQEVALEVFGKIQEIIGTVMPDILKIIDVVWKAIQTLWENYGDRILNHVTILWNYIKTTIQNAITIVRTIISTVLALITGDWAKAWEGVKTVLKTVWDQIVLMITTVLNLILNIFGTNLQKLTEDIRAKWEQIKADVFDFLNRVWEAIKSFIGPIVEAVIKPYVDAYNSLFGPGGTVPKIIAAVSQFVADALKFITEKVNAIRDAIKEPYEKARDALFGPGGIIPKLVSAVSGFVGDVKTAISDKMTAIRDALKEPYEKARDLLFGEPNGIVTKFKSSLVGVWEAIKKYLGDAYEALRDAIIKPFKDAWDKVSGIYESIKNAWNWITGKQNESQGGYEQPYDQGYASGLSATFASPTRILVGERGPERVTVTPLAGGGGPTSNSSFTLNYTAVRSASGYDDAVRAMRRLEWLARMRMVTA